MDSPGYHWLESVGELLFIVERELYFELEGGADQGLFPCVKLLGDPEVRGTSVKSGELNEGSVVLEIQGQKVPGYTNADVKAWLNHCSRNQNAVVMRTIPKGKKRIFSLYNISSHCK